MSRMPQIDFDTLDNPGCTCSKLKFTQEEYVEYLERNPTFFGIDSVAVRDAARHLTYIKDHNIDISLTSSSKTWKT